ncbi:hypothetical protein IFM89_015262 [Coptis chinensis]|uniref:Uncharacterized protein n=1 Tax=Coptis chinensis TaxID=261450 RepID=A0A835LRQ4_9MAGN|nr:hypothetical protein IFM89_015262 [Coptis chinensis]
MKAQYTSLKEMGDSLKNSGIEGKGWYEKVAGIRYKNGDVRPVMKSFWKQVSRELISKIPRLVVRENSRHLYFDYPYSRVVWQGVKPQLGMGNIISNSNGEWLQILQTCKSNSAESEVWRADICATVSAIWQERNMKLFERKSRPPQLVMVKLLEDMKNYILSFVKQVPDCMSTRILFDRLGICIGYKAKLLILCKWLCPENGKVKLNTDGAVNATSRDSTLAVQIAKGVVEPPPWYCLNTVLSIGIKVAELEHCSFSHCYRETNCVVDYLAKMNVGNTDVPWKAFFRSPAVWAMIYAHFCGSWGHYTCLSWLPTYFSEELDLNLREAAWVSVLPPLASVLVTGLAAQFADSLITKGVETTKVRKICQSIAFLSPAACMSVSSLDLGLPHWEVVGILTGGLALSSFALSGLYCTHQDISPQYASILLGITNTVGAVPGIVGVALTGYLLDSTHSWSLSLFAPSIFFYLTGTIIWIVFASCKPQSFSKID